MNRRQFLSTTLAGLLLPRVLRAMPPLRPTTVDAGGRAWSVLAAMGDRINAAGATFGADADFTAVFPLDDDRLLLWVNHEFPPSVYGSDTRFARVLGRPPTPADMRACMGASVLELARTERGFERVVDSSRAWRLDGSTPLTRVTGPAAPILGAEVPGTLSNCGGGVTPWGTVLTCEENHRYHAHEGLGTRDGRIGAVSSTVAGGGFDIPGLHGEWYGWVVEADPYDSTWQPRRHTRLGRYRHESAVFAPPVSGAPLRLYMGDDRAGGSLWRFTSAKKWRAGMSRDRASALLEAGTLAVARLEADGTGRWIPVGLSTPLSAEARSHLGRLAAGWKINEAFAAQFVNAAVLGDLYVDEGALLVDAWLAGLLAGGTPLGRPEGCVCIGDALFAALTTATGLAADDPFRPPMDHADGCVIRLADSGADGLRWSTHTVAGEQFGNPDNLGVDPDGLLLLATDADEPRDGWSYNGLFRHNGQEWEQVLIAPPEAEVCGPSYAPDRTLFCSIQHPAEAWGESAVIGVSPTPQG